MRDGKAALRTHAYAAYRESMPPARKGGDYSVIASGTAFAMSSGDRVRCAIHDDPGNSALQELKVYVNGTLRLTSTAIDDDWSAGAAGLLVRPGNGSNLSYDNVKIGLDANADDDADDEGAQGGSPNGDTKIVDDDFASTTMSLNYDDNGNLTDDGLFKFVYDAWNRLVAAKTRHTSSTTQVIIGAYAYDGVTRRVSKVVTNNGTEVVANDGGNTTVHFYYGRSKQLLESRNGSNQTTWQYVWGTHRSDLILADKQGDGSGNDVDPDNTAGGETANLDHRYFFHADRQGRIVALTDYGSGLNGKIVERYHYAAGVRVLTGEVTGNEAGAVRRASLVGNLAAMTALAFDFEKEGNLGGSALTDDCGNGGTPPMLMTMIDYGCWYPTPVCPQTTRPTTEPTRPPPVDPPDGPDAPPPDCRPCSPDFCKEQRVGNPNPAQTYCDGAGNACCCLFKDNIKDTFPTMGKNKYFRKCLAMHEGTHISLIDRDKRCKDKPPGKPPDPPQPEHCVASLVGLQCIDDYVRGTCHSQGCQTDVCKYLNIEYPNCAECALSFPRDHEQCIAKYYELKRLLRCP